MIDEESLRTSGIWEKAFPLAGFAPALQKPTEEYQKLATMFCPQLHVDPNIFKQELKYLESNFRNPQCAESIFLFRVGFFPQITDGAELSILSSVQEELAHSKYIQEHWKKMPKVAELAFNVDLYKSFQEEYGHVDLKLIESRMQELFEKQFPEGCRSCAIKYRVVRSNVNPELYCIQYFTYWPVQLFPFHVPDYEPIYFFVAKAEKEEDADSFYGHQYQPLLVVFNANPGSLPKQLQPLLSGKRPGHLIRTYINWDTRIRSSKIFPDQFNDLADFMTKAYGGQYLYMKIHNWADSHTDRLFRIHDKRYLRPQFFVTEKWHAYDIAGEGECAKTEPIECELQPLKTEDLAHIEWDIRNPFEAPFLYPMVGKNALFHVPFDLNALCGESEDGLRHMFAGRFGSGTSPGMGFPHISKAKDYRCGLLVALLCMFQRKGFSEAIWDQIEEFATRRSEFNFEFYYEKSQDEAIKEYEDAVAYRIKGWWKSKKEPLQALNYFNRAIELDPLDPLSFFYRGRLYQTSKQVFDPEKAFNDFTQVAKLSPDNAEAFRRCGVFYDLAGQYNAAVGCYDRAIELDPKGIKMWFDKNIKDDPKESNAFKNRAYWYLVKGDIVASLNDLNRALELDPKNAQALHLRAQCYAAMQPAMLNEAIIEVDKALSLGVLEVEDFWSALYNKACFLARIGKTEEAINVLEKLSDEAEDYNWRDAANEDVDFNNISSDPRFVSMVKQKKKD